MKTYKSLYVFLSIASVTEFILIVMINLWLWLGYTILLVYLTVLYCT